MKGYSRIRVIGTARSRSMDFSDLSLGFPEPTKTSLKPQESETKRIRNQDGLDTKNVISSDTRTQDSLSVLEEDQENNVEERFRMKLKRNSSVSSSASALQYVVKKAFSMTRSSSVSERYCRIHDQSLTLASPIHDEDVSLDTMESTRSVKNKHSKGRILKVCKKLFGL